MTQREGVDQLACRRDRARELYEAHWSQVDIAQELGVSQATVSKWLAQSQEPQNTVSRQGMNSQGRKPRLTFEQLRILYDLLQCEPAAYGLPYEQWSHQCIALLIQKKFNLSYHSNYIRHVLQKMQQAVLQNNNVTPYFQSAHVTLYHGDAAGILARLPRASIDCIVTSPPYYGQRDYGVAEQLGLEKHPQLYIDRLVSIFVEAQQVLKPTGSLWVNLGDTYWSGKGRPQGPDLKQKNRRFLRPQDISGPRPLCTPKQLLLIPHRFAIAMQDKGWVVRNDNVWFKVNPTPDPVEDRCASAHEYMFHFVLQRKYYFNRDAVAIPSKGEQHTKAPPSVWTIRSAPTFKKHIAVFPEELVRIPVQATLPPKGVLLDPFCGSGTALSYALAQGGDRRTIGIDISETALAEARGLLSQV